MTIYGPPIFLLPVCMGIVAHYAGSKEQVAGNRRAFLVSPVFNKFFSFSIQIKNLFIFQGALIGGAMIGMALFGFVFNFNFSYIIYMAILGAAAAVDLQLKVASIQRAD